MEKIQLAELKKVNPRDCWTEEDRDFTPWLSQHLALLGREIGIDIILSDVEASVGDFRVDILAKEESTGRKIIIENQLEYTDHNHLGQIITYAAGVKAKIIIWIVSNVREDHQRAIEWLNELNDGTSFFLIKIEILKIGDTNFAPNFDVIVKPKKGGIAIEEPEKREYLAFWTGFNMYINSNYSNTNFVDMPRPRYYFNAYNIRSDAQIFLGLDRENNQLWCNLLISNNKNLFNYLRDRHKESIGESFDNENNEIGWKDAPRNPYVIIAKNVKDIFDPNEAQDHFAWLYEKAEKFREVFVPLLKEFSDSESSHN